MLQHLEIKNYVLIQHLEIDFNPGFSVITGETGAGKSILLGAFALILGKRADSQVLFDKTSKCIIEGTFQIKDYNLKPFFDENQLDHNEIIILRREIGPGGKSRAFINDTPVSLNQLKDLGDRLVNIHSQNSTITLNNTEFQLAVIDSYAGISGLSASFRQNFLEYLENEKKLDELVDKETKSKADQDYFQFLFDELDAANIDEHEQAELEKQLTVLSHAGEIKTSLYQISQVFTHGENNLVGSLLEIKNLIGKVVLYYPSLGIIMDRLESNLIDLRDIQAELEQIDQRVEFNPESLEKISSRLDLLYRLQQKHHVTGNSELITIKEQFLNRLKEITSLDSRITVLKDDLKSQVAILQEKAEELSKARRASFGKFEMEILNMLRHMGIPQAQFKVSHETSSRLNRDGKDHVVFLFNANVGHDLKEISEIASGGELSRLMLSVKSLISQKNLLPTIIFDEIDNGISGDIAGKVADILVRTSRNMQVIVITHLPQIAGKATNHYIVFKEISGKATHSKIKKLEQDDRVGELAKMLGGTEKSDAAIATARELLHNNNF
jgi:DNA repair protein RecN (Recombination protein N)